MKILKYCINQLDKIQAWIGVIGIVLLLLGAHSILFFLFILLIVLPEQSLKEMFSKWTAGLREVEKELEQ